MDGLVGKGPHVAFCAILAVFAVALPAHAADQWHIKCFGFDGHTLAVKALSAEGRAFNVKALATEDPGLHDVKALHPETGEPIAVKVVAPQDQEAAYSDVKAVRDGQLIAIKGITSSGETLDVKAFYDDANERYDIKCVSRDGERLGLKAISPAGQVYDVKGFKELPDQEDLEIEVEAHIKAIPQES